MGINAQNITIGGAQNMAGLNGGNNNNMVNNMNMNNMVNNMGFCQEYG